jgi:hypothetical protein
MAIITDDFKRRFVQTILEDIADSAQHYYIGIGKADEWDSADTVPTIANTLTNERNFRLALQSVKKAEDTSYVVPRVNWTTGTIYSDFSNTQSGYPTQPYYVKTDDQQVYICLEQGKDANGLAVSSTIKPTSVLTTASRLADGYVWKFLYTIGATQSNKFLSGNYMPVRHVDSAGPADPAVDIEQFAIQAAAVKGQIANIDVILKGSGYTSAPTVSIIGNGDSAEATATIASGEVVKVEMKDSAASNLYRPGQNYDYAEVKFTGGGGTGASAAINLADDSGFGASAILDLKSTAMMFNSKPSGAENKDFIIGQNFRQVGIIRNPLDSANNNYVSETGSALTYMQLSAVGVVFTADKTILGSTSGAQAYVNTFDSDKIYYHQDEDTGFIAFQSGEGVTETNGSGSGTIGSGTQALAADINKFTGQIFYIDNRAAIERSAAQTEDLKVIIQL